MVGSRFIDINFYANERGHDVNKGFNDLDALAYILNNIFKIVQDDTAEIGKV